MVVFAAHLGNADYTIFLCHCCFFKNTKTLRNGLRNDLLLQEGKDLNLGQIKLTSTGNKMCRNHVITLTNTNTKMNWQLLRNLQLRDTCTGKKSSIQD